MTTTIAILIIVVHFVFDWFQPRNMQNKKHSDVNVLTLHTLISIVPIFILMLILINGMSIKLMLTCFILLWGTHFLTDLISSNIVHKAKTTKFFINDVTNMGVLDDVFETKPNEYLIIVTTAVDQIAHLVVYFIMFGILL